MKKFIILFVMFFLLSFSLTASAMISETDIEGVYLAEPGEYIVGVDIPSGVYNLALFDCNADAGILINNPGDYGTTVLCTWFGDLTGIYDCENIELEDDQLIYVSISDLVFTKNEM